MIFAQEDILNQFLGFGARRAAVPRKPIAWFPGMAGAPGTPKEVKERFRKVISRPFRGLFDLVSMAEETVTEDVQIGKSAWNRRSEASKGFSKLRIRQSGEHRGVCFRGGELPTAD